MKRRVTADKDERPAAVGTKVCLSGEVRDGPTGEVMAAPAPDLRVVLFEGESKPIECRLADLRRLP